MKGSPKHTLFNRCREIHDPLQSFLEKGDNIDDKNGNKQLFGLFNYNHTPYMFSGDDIGFNEMDRENFIFPDRVHINGRNINGENGEFNSGGISSNIFLSHDKIPLKELQGRGLYRNFNFRDRQYFPYKS